MGELRLLGRAVVAVVAAHLVSLTLVADGLPVLVENTVALLDGGAPSRMVGEGGAFNPNLVDVSSVKLPKRTVAASPTTGAGAVSVPEAGQNPLQRFGEEVVLARARARAQTKIDRAREKTRKAQDKLKSEQSHSKVEVRHKKAATHETSQKKTQQKLQAVNKAVKKRVSAQAKAQLQRKKMAKMAEAAAEASVRRQNKISHLLHKEGKAKRVEKAKAKAAAEKSQKANAKPALVETQPAVPLSTNEVQSAHTSSPPVDGMADNYAMKHSKTMQAMRAVNSETKKKQPFRYDLAKAERRAEKKEAAEMEAAAEAKYRQKAADEDRLRDSQSHKAEESEMRLMESRGTVSPRRKPGSAISCVKNGNCDPSVCLCKTQAKKKTGKTIKTQAKKKTGKPISCYNKENKCDPNVCLCKTGQRPVPKTITEQKQKQKKAPGKVSCFKNNKCDPNVCLCKKGGKAPMKKSKGKVSCTKQGECDPNVCLCKKGAKPVPLKPYMKYPNPGKVKQVFAAPQAEAEADTMAESYLKGIGMGAEKAAVREVGAEQRIEHGFAKFNKDALEVRKDSQAAKKAMLAKAPTKEKAAARAAWKEEKVAKKQIEALKATAAKEWQQAHPSPGQPTELGRALPSQLVLIQSAVPSPQRWVLQRTAELNKLMTLLGATNNALAQKRAANAAQQTKLHILKRRLGAVVHGQQDIRNDDMSIEQSSEELSEEELGQSNAKRASSTEDLGESGDLGESESPAGITKSIDGKSSKPKPLHRAHVGGDSLEDSAGVALAKMEAKFSGIESNVNGAAKEEAHLEVLARRHKRDRKRRAIQKEVRAKAAKRKALLKAHETKKQQKMENVLAKEEARLRMTTSKKVKAQLKFERVEDMKRARIAKEVHPHHPISRLTPEEETREEYQRMYLANAEQQMVQEKTDLQNRLADIKGGDARSMKVLTGDLLEKKQSLLGDIQTVRTLSSDYERDHELAESLRSKNGAGSLANTERSVEQQDLSTESRIATAAQAEMNRLQNDPDAHVQDSLIHAAKQALRTSSINNRDLGDAASTHAPLLTLQQVKLAAKLASVKETLSLKLAAFKAERERERKLLAQATAVRTGALAARVHEEQAKSTTSAMQHVANTLNGKIAKHENDMQLSSSLFRAKEESTSELGESASTKKTLPPVQAELNWEASQLANAEAQLRRIHEDGPKIIHEQTMTDKRQMGKALRLANSKLLAVKKRFVSTAEELSPKIKTQHQLDEAVDDEQNRQQELAGELHSLADDARQVNGYEKAASDNAQGIV